MQTCAKRSIPPILLCIETTGFLIPVSFIEICFHLTLPLAERVMKSYAVTILMKRLQQYFQMVNTMNIACDSNFRVYG